MGGLSGEKRRDTADAAHLEIVSARCFAKIEFT
jgi:hypothetical protein